jgi:hypothetical protein
MIAPIEAPAMDRVPIIIPEVVLPKLKDGVFIIVVATAICTCIVFVIVLCRQITDTMYCTLLLFQIHRTTGTVQNKTVDY